MDIKSFNKKLIKISALTDTGNDNVQLSPLERDLLLSYIRDLYDLALDNQPVKHQTSSVEIKKQEKIEAVVTDVVVTPTTQIPEEITIPKETYIPPVSTPEIVEPPKATVIVENIELPKVTHTETVIQVEIPKQVTKPSNLNPDQLAELFADEKVTDLSDKLALTPVKDLTKSMGINERIFTQQELFGNNQMQFNETLQKLNNCQNFIEAKQYLLDNVISVYDWTNEQKIKKAATFVKLVKRKFS
jgi:hypothetical protein